MSDPHDDFELEDLRDTERAYDALIEATVGAKMIAPTPDMLRAVIRDALRYRKLRPTIYPCGNYACFGRVPITYDPDHGEIEHIREQADAALDAMPEPPR